MWPTSLLRGGKRHGSAPKRPGFRPTLEALEDRCVPSTLTVTNNLDSGKGSLRYEIARAEKSAAGKDTIVFAPSLDGQTITLTSGELYITTALTIQGPGASKLTISGDNSSRVFDVALNVNVALSGLTISNGFAVHDGGGIYNLGYLSVSRCVISANQADYGGGIYNNNTLSVSGCVVSNNLANFAGGGIYNGVNAPELIVSNSLFTNNHADNIYGPYTDEGGNIFN
ncbi:MAG TPA: hypothetical protein VKE98_23205 [Gemmataceae bacterium]|nr:hypothetical protein [Gemmataceae bacterium]